MLLHFNAVSYCVTRTTLWSAADSPLCLEPTDMTLQVIQCHTNGTYKPRYTEAEGLTACYRIPPVHLLQAGVGAPAGFARLAACTSVQAVHAQCMAPGAYVPVLAEPAPPS